MISIAVGLSVFTMPLAFCEETSLIPILAEPIPLKSIEPPEVKVTKITRLKGAQNSPPFIHVEAKKCEVELRKRGIKFSVLDKITDPKDCLVERPLTLSGLSKGITLSNDITVRCEFGLALDNLISHVVIPSAKLHLGKKLTEVKTSTSYQCRTRNGITGVKVSEHGFANGIDITGFHFDDDTVVTVSPKEDIISVDGLNAAKFQAAVRAGACAYFTTVLGPGTNATHNDHFHFDLAFRKSGYRLCE